MAEDEKGPWWEHTEEEERASDAPETVDEAPTTMEDSPQTIEAPPTMESPPTMMEAPPTMDVPQGGMPPGTVDAPPTFESSAGDFISHTPATVAINPNAPGGMASGFTSTPPTQKMQAAGSGGQPYGNFPGSDTNFSQTPSPMGDFQHPSGMQPGYFGGSGLPVMPGPMPGAPGQLPPTAHYQQLQLSEFGPGTPYATGRQNLDLLYDVPVPITVVLGRSVMRIQEVLGLQPGSVVTLDRNDGEPVDLLIKDKLIAQGEVVVIDGNYGIKITRIVEPERRLEAGTRAMPGL